MLRCCFDSDLLLLAERRRWSRSVLHEMDDTHGLLSALLVYETTFFQRRSTVVFITYAYRMKASLSLSNVKEMPYLEPKQWRGQR